MTWTPSSSARTGAPTDRDFVPVANSPRSGDANCYDNVCSWQGCPLPEYEEWQPPSPPSRRSALDEAGSRSVHLCFGEVDLVRRLVNLPRADELQTQLSRRHIDEEVAALSRPAAAVEPEPVEGPRPVSGRVGALTFHGGVGTVNIYLTITIANGGGEDDVPPLITVRGQ